MSGKSLSTVFEDDYLLVINKPPNLVVTPADSHQEQTVSEILTEEFGIEVDRGGVVHRLDKDTSGLLLVAKSSEILEKLQAQFKERTVKKMYICLVHGFTEKEGSIEGSIGRNPGDREKFIVLEDGKEAQTDYKVENYYQMGESVKDEVYSEFNKIQKRKLERNQYGQFTLLNCFPKTGRTHQIRVHLKHIGHSLVSDQTYGGRKTVRLDRRWCKRQFLHATKLEFDHPVSGERISLESKLPEDLMEALSKLEIAQYVQ